MRRFRSDIGLLIAALFLSVACSAEAPLDDVVQPLELPTEDPGSADPGHDSGLSITTPPLFEMSIVDLSGEVTTMEPQFDDPSFRLGDVTCDEPCAFPFGAPLPEGVPNIGFEFIVAKGTQIRAASSGFVSFIRENNGTQDFEVHVMLVENGAYITIYDHIQPTVSVGDTLELGQILGTAGPWGPAHGRIEFQLNFEDPVTFETWAVCPADYGTDTFVALHQKWLDMHNMTAATSTHPHFQTYDSLCMVEKRFP